MTTPLPLITALARSGALDRAWALFEAGGYAEAHDNAAALAVKGRLYKDRGLGFSGEARRKALTDAANAYLFADNIAPAPYLLINVATLSLLSGDQARASQLASEALVRLDQSSLSETPYWIEATRAEALLLLGQVDMAGRALTAAIGHAPESWEDHASTLRQFGLILSETGGDTAWLGPHRPPCSVHFAGHLGVAGADETALRDQLDTLLDKERIGFGYGALAAGADIIIAEALLAKGAELTAILPVSIDNFLAQSITPLGQDWRTRFDACMDGASNHIKISDISGAFEPLTINLAGDVGMGSAILNARRLESRAAQIVVADDGDGHFGGGLHTARDAQRWEHMGNAQFVLRAPRTAIQASVEAGEERPVPSRRLLAMLSVHLFGSDRLDDSDWPNVDEALFSRMASWAEETGVEPYLAQRFGDRIDLVFQEVDHACSAAFALQQKFAELTAASPDFWTDMALTIGGHYGIVHASPANGPVQALMGPSANMASDIVRRTLPGSICVSENFAAALAFRNHAAMLEYVGELPARGTRDELRLFAIKPVRD